jgi:hypothetical protein
MSTCFEGLRVGSLKTRHSGTGLAMTMTMRATSAVSGAGGDPGKGKSTTLICSFGRRVQGDVPKGEEDGHGALWDSCDAKPVGLVAMLFCQAADREADSATKDSDIVVLRGLTIHRIVVRFPVALASTSRRSIP